MVQDIFFQISLILVIALTISFIMRLLKQPLIIGYILTGILVGPFLFDLLPQESTTLQTFSELGIAFLLFIVGLHLSPRVIKEVGKISLITGIGQVIFTSVIGYFIALLLGFPVISSIYIAIALTFSSTIIIMKLLSDKDALDKLYGKISIGFLLVQDIIAIIILIIISSFSNGGNILTSISQIAFKGVIILIFLVPLSYFVLPKLSSFFAKSQEFLFVFAITWGLGLASLFFYAGFSVEVGALIAGVMLSISPYSYEISSKLRPLRDFFIISFFILLGHQLVFKEISNLIFPALIFSLFVLIGNPLIIMVLMGIFGYSRNTGFMAGLTVAQISEFSLILIALGVKIGHLSNEILSFVTVIGLITIAGSAYLITYSEKIYTYIYPYLSIFEKKNLKEKKESIKNYEYILFGENRIGFSIMKSFKKLNKNYLIVDYNPTRVNKLSSEKVSCIFGDVSNSEFLDSLKLEKAKLVASTIPEQETNMIILSKVRSINKNAIIIVTARQIQEAFDLYSSGANYVILPHFLGGEYIANIIEKAKDNKKEYEKEKKKQIKDLKERLGEGQEHPKIEKHV
ncbi:MAG: cation:proton antiporter [archaeon]